MFFETNLDRRSSVKPGDLVRNRPVTYRFHVFDNIPGEEWYGLVLITQKPPENPPGRHTKYNRVHVLLSSHGGTIGKTWLTDKEINDHIEVLT